MDTTKKIAILGIGAGIVWLLGEMREKEALKAGRFLEIGSLYYTKGSNPTKISLIPKLFRESSPVITLVDETTITNNTSDSCQKQWDEMRFVKAPTEQERINFLADCRSRATAETVIAELKR